MPIVTENITDRGKFQESRKPQILLSYTDQRYGFPHIYKTNNSKWPITIIVSNKIHFYFIWGIRYGRINISFSAH